MTPMTFMFAPIIFIAVAVLGKEIRKSALTLFMELSTAQNDLERNLTKKIDDLSQQVAELQAQLDKSNVDS